ncbi:MAG: DNA-directed RNA polymerase subunit omega [Rickettsiales bacterium]|jgi:DNA-directed RNA polymerase subunit omega|nr:DNA-directed RNA polymerase subunit omega [Rickettsiales bacterium]
MARITISDDLSFVESKYELGMLAGQRVRDLNGGEQPLVSMKDGDKPPVIALREIASGKLNINALRREFIQSYKKVPVVDDNAADTLESDASAPELKELDEELSGEAAKKEEIEAAEDLEEESEGTAEAVETQSE